MINVSTGFKRSTHLGTSFAAMFNGGCIELYANAMPGADEAAGASPIARITQNGATYAHGFSANGLNFRVDDTGLVLPSETANWILTGLVAGTATWARLMSVNDDSTLLSTTYPRINIEVNPVDDLVGIFMANPVMVVAAQQPSTFFAYGIPPFS